MPLSPSPPPPPRLTQVRASFEYSTAQLAASAPSRGLPTPAEEARKFMLLPEVEDGSDVDPHDQLLFPYLPAGEVVERNPLPDLAPPYVRKPFLGRAIALHELVMKLGRRRNKEARPPPSPPCMPPRLPPGSASPPPVRILCT